VPVFWGLGSGSVVHGDETLYSLPARTMAQGEGFRVPLLDGEAMFSKAPLGLWATALAYRVLGVSEFSTRLCSALSAIATCAVVCVLAQRIFASPWAGYLAVLLLIFQPTYLHIHCARHGEPDALAILFFSLAMLCLWQALARASTRGLYGIGICCGLTAMSKTLVVGLLPAAVALVALVLTGAWRNFRWHRYLLAAALFLLITAPWHWLAYQEYGDGFLHSYFWQQTVARVAGGAAPGEPRWQALQVLRDWHPFAQLLWVSPFVLTVGTSLAWRRGGVLLLTWGLVVLAAVLRVDSRLPWYILPAYPAVACLLAGCLLRMAQWLSGRPTQLLFWPLALAGWIAAAGWQVDPSFDPVHKLAPKAALDLRLRSTGWLPEWPVVLSLLLGVIILLWGLSYGFRVYRKPFLRGIIVAAVVLAPLGRMVYSSWQPLLLLPFQSPAAAVAERLQKLGGPGGRRLYLGRTLPHMAERFYLDGLDLAQEATRYFCDREQDFLAAANDPAVDALLIPASLFPAVREELLKGWIVTEAEEMRGHPGLRDYPDYLVVLRRRETEEPSLCVDSEELHRILREGNPRQRVRAAVSLAMVGDFSIREPVVALLQERQQKVLPEALLALQYLGDAGLVNRLTEVAEPLSWTASQQLRLLALQAAFGEPQAAEQLRARVATAGNLLSYRNALKVAFELDFLATTRRLAASGMGGEKYQRWAYLCAGKSAIWKHLDDLVRSEEPRLRDYAVHLLKRPDSRSILLTAKEKERYLRKLDELGNAPWGPQLKDLVRSARRGFQPQIWNIWVPESRKKEAAP
jgi:hypothetical protein